MKIKFKKSHGGREKCTSVKYKKDLSGDCVLRALAHAFDRDYETVMHELFALGLEMFRMPNDDIVIETYLKRQGIKRNSPLTHHGKKKYQVGNFPLPGTHLIRSSGHLTCIKDGVLFDTWDCRPWKAQSYYTVATGDE